MPNVRGVPFSLVGPPSSSLDYNTLRQKAGYSVIRSPRGVRFRTENDERLRYQELGSPFLKTGPSAKIFYLATVSLAIEPLFC